MNSFDCNLLDESIWLNSKEEQHILDECDAMSIDCIKKLESKAFSKCNEFEKSNEFEHNDFCNQYLSNDAFLN